MKKPSVAIVGSGISSLYAILACNENGIRPDLFSTDYSYKRLVGSVWLKWIPEWMERYFMKEKINIRKIGSESFYVEKQWGNIEIISSFPVENTVEFGYNPFTVSSFVFSNLSNFREIFRLKESLKDLKLMELSKQYDILFHSFPSENTLKENFDILVDINCLITKIKCLDNEVLYDGTNSFMVRSSKLFGFEYIECIPYIEQSSFSETFKYRLNSSNGFKFKDIKPKGIPYVYNLKRNIVPIGRLGRMERKLMAHDNYSLVKKYLSLL
jgi:hypothetical protein